MAATLAPTLSLRAAETPGRPGRYRLGSVFLTPRVQLKNLGVDSNVFAQEFEGVSDTIIQLSPSLTIAPSAGRFRLSGLGSLDINRFLAQGSESSTDHYLAARLERDVGRVTLLGGGGVGRFRERFAFEETERIQRRERHVFAGLVLRPTTRLSGSFQGTRRVYEFPGDSSLAVSIRQILDRTTLVGSFDARYEVTRLTALVASWETFRDRFANRLGSAPDEVSSSRGLIGLDFGPRAVVNGRLLAGLRSFPEAGGVAKYRGLALLTNLGVPFGWGRINGLLDRDVLYAVNRASSAEDQRRNTYVWTRQRGDVTFALPARLTGTVFVSHESARFLLPFVVNRVSSTRTDRLWNVGGGLQRRVKASLRLGVGVDWQRRTSQFAGSSYSRVRYGLQGEFAP